MNKRSKKAFTLIELLVVIAIIALLLAVLMPSLQKAKEIAKLVVCMSNYKGMLTAFKTYSADNNGELVGGNVHSRSSGGPVSSNNHDWALAPVIRNSSGQLQYFFGGTEDEKLDNELRGIRNGALYPYIEDTDIYHCPADRRGINGPGKPPSFRSFSITAQMNGEPYYRRKEISASKETQIVQPDSRFVFIDDFDSRGFNMGSWMFGYDLNNPNNHRIADPISVWHPKKCNFGFADGHTESYVWKNNDTHKYCVEKANGGPITVNPVPTSGNNEDVRFLAQGYRAR